LRGVFFIYLSIKKKFRRNTGDAILKSSAITILARRVTILANSILIEVVDWARR
jgi:hypothetical protein